MKNRENKGKNNEKQRKIRKQIMKNREKIEKIQIEKMKEKNNEKL